MKLLLIFFIHSITKNYTHQERVVRWRQNCHQVETIGGFEDYI